MMERKHKTSRGFSKLNFYTSRITGLFQPFLGNLLSILPALFYSCVPAAENPGFRTSEPVTKVSLAYPTEGIGTLDVFVFKDNPLQKLDCYQRFGSMDEWRGSVVSSSGNRIISVLANSPYGKDHWLNMNSRGFLNEVHMNLEDETAENHVMFGETSVDTYRNEEAEYLHLRPLVCEVRLNSICCDFTGKAYDGERIKDMKVYLTNVNAECRLSDDDGPSPMRIINAGRLEEDDIAGFKDPGIIMRSIDGEIGKKAVRPGINLWCYENCHEEETPGTPYTRLVIEGRISGRTCYWPIDINRDTEYEPGVRRGICHSYDIVITRKGTSEPDIPVKADDITINHKVKRWNEKEEYEVRF